MKSKNALRPAKNHPAIQNLRRFYRDFAQDGSSVKSFAQAVGIDERKMGTLLRGEHEPTEETVRLLATCLRVDFLTMMTVDFDFIPYPVQRFKKPRKSGRHVTKEEIRMQYDTMMEEVSQLVSESDVEYGEEILKIIKRHKP